MSFAGQSSSNSSNGNGSFSGRPAASSLAEPVVPKDLNPNYRPGPPQAPVHDMPSRHELNNRMRTEEEQLSVLMSKKGTRVAMYSGSRRYDKEKGEKRRVRRKTVIFLDFHHLDYIAGPAKIEMQPNSTTQSFIFLHCCSKSADENTFLIA